MQQVFYHFRHQLFQTLKRKLQTHKKLSLLGFMMILTAGFASGQNPDTLIQTVHQMFNSRIYLLDDNGNTMDYYDYENYRMAGMTIADGELYVADAFGPVVLKVDPEDGSLENFILELPHTAYYGLAHDSSYFYVEDFGTLYRYDEAGEQQSSASFGETILGMTWDGQYLWTIVDYDNMIRCWDLSGWPALEEIEENAVAKPSEACRGLFYDGNYFWTAEAMENIAGDIYRFDSQGNVAETYDGATATGWGIAVKLDTTATDIKPVTQIPSEQCHFDEETGKLIITTNRKINLSKSARIYDIRGNLVKKASVSNSGNNRYAIGINNFAPGIYIYAIPSKSGKISGKFRINR